jgi:hypothetical protein
MKYVMFEYTHYIILEVTRVKTSKVLVILTLTIIGGIIFTIVLVAFLDYVFTDIDEHSEKRLNAEDVRLLDNTEFRNLMSTFYSNQIVARKKYLGREYKIKDEVNDIIDGWNEIEFYIPKDDVKVIDSYYISCSFKDSSDLLDVRVGDTVTVIGILDQLEGFECDDPLFNNKLVDCYLWNDVSNKKIPK